MATLKFYDKTNIDSKIPKATAAEASKFLRGDGTWAVPASGSDFNVLDIIATGVAEAEIPENNTREFIVQNQPTAEQLAEADIVRLNLQYVEDGEVQGAEFYILNYKIDVMGDFSFMRYDEKYMHHDFSAAFMPINGVTEYIIDKIDLEVDTAADNPYRVVISSILTDKFEVGDLDSEKSTETDKYFEVQFDGEDLTSADKYLFLYHHGGKNFRLSNGFASTNFVDDFSNDTLTHYFSKECAEAIATEKEITGTISSLSLTFEYDSENQVYKSYFLLELNA